MTPELLDEVLNAMTIHLWSKRRDKIHRKVQAGQGCPRVIDSFTEGSTAMVCCYTYNGILT